MDYIQYHENLRALKTSLKPESIELWDRATSAFGTEEPWKQSVLTFLDDTKDQLKERRLLLKLGVRLSGIDKSFVLWVARELPMQELEAVVIDIFYLGLSEAYYEACYELIKSLSLEWLESNFDSLFQQLLEEGQDDEHVYEFVLSGLWGFNETLAHKLSQRALTSDNPKVVELGKLYLEDD